MCRKRSHICKPVVSGKRRKRTKSYVGREHMNTCSHNHSFVSKSVGIISKVMLAHRTRAYTCMRRKNRPPVRHHKALLHAAVKALTSSTKRTSHQHSMRSQHAVASVASQSDSPETQHSSQKSAKNARAMRSDMRSRASAGESKTTHSHTRADTLCMRFAVLVRCRKAHQQVEKLTARSASLMPHASRRVVYPRGRWKWRNETNLMLRHSCQTDL